MPANTVRLILSTRPGASRGAAAPRAASVAEQQAINRAAGGLFEIEAVETHELGAARAGGEELSVEYDADQIVRVELDDGGELWLTLERLQELTGQRESQLVLGSDTPLAQRAVPSRGIGRWLRRLSIVKVLWGDELRDAAAVTAVTQAIATIEGQLLEGRTGLYRCEFNADRDAPVFETVPGEIARSKQPILILLHGTASSTRGSFSGLWRTGTEHPSTRQRADSWQKLIAELYDEQVFALEHCTLSESPIRNACVVLEHLPADQPVHLISHSRGGLVGELLCRGRLQDRAEPVTAEDIERYLSAYPGQDAATDAARAQIEDELQRLNALLIAKRPRVARFVRVGCPARGTTLAANRLDVYINLVLSGVQLIGSKLLGPAAGAFVGALKSLAIAIARKRFDDALLPGIKAMVPDGGLARFINDPALQVDADLCVIAGNSEIGGGLRQTLLVALTNLYYRQANDWVVETDAMVGGHPRSEPAVRFLDLGRKQPVNHFSYFRNDASFNAIVQALSGNHRASPIFTSLADEPVKTKSRGERRAPPRCITVMLPGLPGSHLRAGGDRVWLDLYGVALGRLHRLDVRNSDEQVTPDGWLSSRYAALAEHLEEHGHRVVVFDYDWRLSLAYNAGRLAGTLHEVSREPGLAGLPLRILAHSMGGWVALYWLVTDTDALWDELCRDRDARLVMAGTPLAGTFESVQLLIGQHPLLSMLALLDLKQHRDELLAQLSYFPGLLEMLPASTAEGADGHCFDDRYWAGLARALPERWTHPQRDALQQALGVRSRVDVRRPPRHAHRVCYLAGQDTATPRDLTVADEKLVFHYTAEGDGLTTWDSVPDWLRDARCWYLPGVKHGDLLCVQDAYAPVRELLESGDTRLLPRKPPAAVRDADAIPDLGRDTPLLFPSEQDLEAAALHGSLLHEGIDRSSLPRCHVRIRHGNLHFVDLPMMVGHYQDENITGSEAGLDAVLGGHMRKLLRANLYPGPLNTVEIFMQPGAQGIKGAVVVGLGRLGELTAPKLRETLRRALIHFGRDHADRLRERDAHTGEQARARDRELALATLVIGSGAGGLSRIDAVKALLEAAVAANRQLQDLDAPLIQRLDIVERFEDAAIAIAHDCARVSSELDDALSFDFTVHAMPGGLRRAFFDEPEPWWRRIQITRDRPGKLHFAPLTDRAGIDVNAHPVQTALIDGMLEAATASTVSNPEIGKSLFELLIPLVLKTQVEAHGGMVLLVDEPAARYPWELLIDRRSREPAPLATRIGMVRQLYDRSGGRARPPARNSKALVVGDTPAGQQFPELPGAVAEAEIVCESLNSGGFDAGQALIRRPGLEVVMALTNDDYQIVHLAGHGVIDHPMTDPRTGVETRKTGMVLGGALVLGADEIQALPEVPELAFINCCHLGASREPPPGGARNELAANLGTAFIRAGATCVVAAGWAVDDQAAALFARTFYQRMLSGCTFGDAITHARKQVFQEHPDSNTWGAYQCYGDHAFRLAPDASPKDTTRRYFNAVEVEVEAANICAEAEKADGQARERLMDRLRELEAKLDEFAYLRTGVSCAAIGAAWHELGEFEKSIDWNGQAVECEDGGARLKTMESHANALARFAEAKIKQVLEEPEADRKLTILVDANVIATRAITRADALQALGDTAERAELRASAYKHHGIVNLSIAETTNESTDRASARARARRSLITAYKLYRESADTALAATGRHRSYPLLNAVALWLYLSRHGGRSAALADVLQTQQEVAAELDALAAQFAESPPTEGDDRFWDRTDRINLDLHRALADGHLHQPPAAPAWQSLAARYREEFRLASQRKRDSVIKQIRLLATLLGKRTPQGIALEALIASIARQATGE